MGGEQVPCVRIALPTRDSEPAESKLIHDVWRERVGFAYHQIYRMRPQRASEARKQRLIKHARTKWVQFIRVENRATEKSVISLRKSEIKPSVVLIVVITLPLH